MEFFKPLEALSLHGNVRWVQRLDLYLKASGKIQENEDVQCAILLHVIGEETMEIYNTFQFATEEDRTKLDVLVEVRGVCDSEEKHRVRKIPILGVQATRR